MLVVVLIPNLFKSFNEIFFETYTFAPLAKSEYDVTILCMGFVN